MFGECDFIKDFGIVIGMLGNWWIVFNIVFDVFVYIMDGFCFYCFEDCKIDFKFWEFG